MQAHGLQLWLLAGACWAALAQQPQTPTAALQAALPGLLAAKSSKWNNSAIGVAIYSPRRGVGVQLASGAAPDARWLWGSGTKMFTASSVLKLVQAGSLSLNSTAAEPVDAALQRLNRTSLEQLGFPAQVANVTVYQLLSMTSGIFDLPAELRQWQMAAPGHDFGPIELLSRTKKEPACAPGKCGWYSDVNYILLGLLLMTHQNASSWESVKQSPLPLAAEPLPSIEFAKHGPLSAYNGTVDGRQPGGSWVRNMSALGGWTCGNVIASPLDMAKWVHLLYGDGQCKVVQCSTVLEMIRFSMLSPYFPVYYGLGTMGIYPDFFGHGGATWGFYSLSGYNPYLDFSMTLVTNMETKIFQQNLWDIHLAVYAEVKRIFNQTDALEPGTHADDALNPEYMSELARHEHLEYIH